MKTDDEIDDLIERLLRLRRSGAVDLRHEFRKMFMQGRADALGSDSDMVAAYRSGSFAVMRFGAGLMVLKRFDARSVQEVPFDELDNWRMYNERLMLDCMEHVAILDEELKRRSPPVESLVAAMRAGDRDGNR